MSGEQESTTGSLGWHIYLGLKLWSPWKENKQNKKKRKAWVAQVESEWSSGRHETRGNGKPSFKSFIFQVIFFNTA